MDGWQQIAGQLAQIGLPALGGLFGGPLGGTIGGIVGKGVAAALGVQPTPQAVQQAIVADPSGSAVKLAEIEAETKRQQAELDDIASARSQTIELARIGSPIAYGAPIVSALVLITFVIAMSLVLWRGVPPGDIAVTIGLIEVLKALSIAVVGYWVGSSEGARRNADRLQQVTTTALGVPPGQVAQSAIAATKRR